ncbi:hypothetical protein DFH08DRAFT_825984 [Mycena albidolilacea]|uniref:Uncharacterized protein n=1 Tax=Mycena albidolilacea TaxID=1033008 RepID=A0AAD6Z153_9AGAR|nr:hypothetical protein DFH08DRAFT_825984 [Mycena albidolilacea]
MKFTLLTTTVLAYTTALVSFYRGGAIMLVNALGPRAGDAGQYLFDCVQGGSSKVLKIVNNCGANNCIIPGQYAHMTVELLGWLIHDPETGSNQNDYCAPSKDSGEE